jgi:hypothetical protein
MSNVLIFTPQHELDYQSNLEDFIQLTNKLISFDKKYQHSSNYWPGVGNFTIFWGV